jgi:hypothetical protein
VAAANEGAGETVGGRVGMSGEDGIAPVDAAMHRT